MTLQGLLGGEVRRMNSQAERLQGLLGAKREHDRALTFVDECVAAGALIEADCWWALFGNRAADKQRRRGDSVY